MTGSGVCGWEWECDWKWGVCLGVGECGWEWGSLWMVFGEYVVNNIQVKHLNLDRCRYSVTYIS